VFGNLAFIFENLGITQKILVWLGSPCLCFNNFVFPAYLEKTF